MNQYVTDNTWELMTRLSNLDTGQYVDTDREVKLLSDLLTNTSSPW